jgi:hypothetical protein
LIDWKDTPDSSKLIEYALQGIYCMIGGSGKENILNMLDPENGHDLELET